MFRTCIICNTQDQSLFKSGYHFCRRCRPQVERHPDYFVLKETLQHQELARQFWQPTPLALEATA